MAIEDFDGMIPFVVVREDIKIFLSKNRLKLLHILEKVLSGTWLL